MSNWLAVLGVMLALVLAGESPAQEYQPGRPGRGAVRGWVQAPDVTGMAEAEARQALQEAGLRARQRQLKADPECDDPALVGLVLRQTPAAEGPLRRGAWVDLIVCPGQPRGKRAIMPSVVGLPLPEARSTLTRLGLKPRLQRRGVCPGPELMGRVTSQRPAAGEQVRPGQVVVLTHCPER